MPRALHQRTGGALHHHQLAVDALVLDVTSNAGQVFFIEPTCTQAEIERRIVATHRTQQQKLTAPAAYRELRDAGAFAGLSMPAPSRRRCWRSHWYAGRPASPITPNLVGA